jgi:hypothetical protein
VGRPSTIPHAGFVLTYEPREPLPRQGGTTYKFATHGIEAALDQAKAAAGDKN